MNARRWACFLAAALALSPLLVCRWPEPEDILRRLGRGPAVWGMTHP